MTVYRHGSGEFEPVDTVGMSGGDAVVKVRRTEGWEEIWPGSDSDGLEPVDTHRPADVTDDAATLVGELTSLEGEAEATCWFRYRLAGGGPPRETDRQTLEATGTFEADVDGLATGNDYGGEYDVWALTEVGGSTYAGRIQTITTDT